MEVLSVIICRFADVYGDETIASLERDGFDVLLSGRPALKAPQGFTLMTTIDFEAIAERAG